MGRVSGSLNRLLVGKLAPAQPSNPDTSYLQPVLEYLPVSSFPASPAIVVVVVHVIRIFSYLIRVFALAWLVFAVDCLLQTRASRYGLAFFPVNLMLEIPVFHLVALAAGCRAFGPVAPLVQCARLGIQYTAVMLGTGAVANRERMT